MSGKVLIVIPTLNRPELCARAVRSVLRQKYENWYLAVAINGFPEYVEDWTEKELVYYNTVGDLPAGKGYFGSYHKAGLGSTLNSVLGAFLSATSETECDYWMNLEDDDELDPFYLETMVDALERSGADVVNCLQRQLPKKIQSNGGEMEAIQLQKRNWVNWPECLWRKGVYEDVGPIAEDVGPATDWDYHLRCVAAGVKYHFVDAVLVTHHWHDGGASGSPNYCLQVDGKQYIARRRAEGAYD